MKRRDLRASSNNGFAKRKEDEGNSDEGTTVKSNSLSSEASHGTSREAGDIEAIEATLPMEKVVDTQGENTEQQSFEKRQGFNYLHAENESANSRTVGAHAVYNQGSVETTHTKTSAILTSTGEIASPADPDLMLKSLQSTDRNITTLAKSESFDPVQSCLSTVSCDINSRNNSLKQRPSVLRKSINYETVPEEAVLSLSLANSGNSGIKDTSSGNSKSVSVINIKRETGVIDSKRDMSEYMPSTDHSPKSSKSRAINRQQDQVYPSFTGDNPSRSGNVREIITTDIPQSMSTDSGIGSPLESRTGIDPGVSQDIEEGQDEKWKVENSPVSSLATRVVPPCAQDRSENCFPCVYQGDNPLLSSSRDTSNYPRISAKTAIQSFHSSAFSKHDRSPDNPPPTSVKENFELESRTFPSEKEVSFKNFAKALAKFPQKATKFHDKTFTSRDKNSIITYTQNVDKSVPIVKSNYGLQQNSDSSISDNEKQTSVIHTIHTSEFTVEHETCNSTARNNGKRIADLFSESKQNEASSPELTSADISTPETLDQCRISGGLNSSSHATEEIQNDASDNDNKELHECLQDSSDPSDFPTCGIKVKGILKTTSAPTLGEKRERAVTLVEIQNRDSKGESASSRSVSFNQIHTKNTFSYNNIAFEGEIITEPSKRSSLAEVVSHIMRQSSVVEVDEDNSHPYGRDSSLTDLMTGKRRDNYSMDAGKMIVWLALAIMIVSLAGGIIFMSETYNLNHRNQVAWMPGQETTTPDIDR